MTSGTLSRRRALAALDMLAVLSEPVCSEEFQARLLGQAGALFDADRVSLANVSGPGTSTGASWPREMPPALAEVFRWRAEEHPAVIALRRASGPCFRLRDEFSLYELRRLPLYEDFMHPLGDRDQLVIEISANGVKLLALGMFRTNGEFKADDLQLLSMIAGPIRQLYDVAKRRAIQQTTLTVREEQMLHLISEGHTDRAIAHRLGVSQRTVEKHLESLRAKLGVTSRAAAVARWLACAATSPQWTDASLRGRPGPSLGGLAVDHPGGTRQPP